MPPYIPQLDDLIGHFHAHITFQHDGDSIQPPKGWKNTIILLRKGERHQKDVMITKHFLLAEDHYPSLQTIKDELKNAQSYLKSHGCNVSRVKLEHEDLPTLPPTKLSYRECHIKIKVPKGISIVYTEPLVASSNSMEVLPDSTVTFLNARFYDGTVAETDQVIEKMVAELSAKNPSCDILEVKRETTVMDSNHALDSWWA